MIGKFSDALLLKIVNLTWQSSSQYYADYDTVRSLLLVSKQLLTCLNSLKDVIEFDRRYRNYLDQYFSENNFPTGYANTLQDVNIDQILTDDGLSVKMTGTAELRHGAFDFLKKTTGKKSRVCLDEMGTNLYFTSIKIQAKSVEKISFLVGGLPFVIIWKHQIEIMERDGYVDLMVLLKKMFIPGEFWQSREIQIVHDRDVKYDITAGKLKSCPEEMIAWMYTSIGYPGAEIGDTSRNSRIRLNCNFILTGILVMIKDSGSVYRDDLVSEFNLTFNGGTQHTDMTVPAEWCSTPPSHLWPQGVHMKGKFYYLPLDKKINFSVIDNTTMTIRWEPDIFGEKVEILISDFHDNQIRANIMMGLAMAN